MVKCRDERMAMAEKPKDVDEVSEEELEHAGELLPDREAMSVISTGEDLVAPDPLEPLRGGERS